MGWYVAPGCALIVAWLVLGAMLDLAVASLGRDGGVDATAAAGLDHRRPSGVDTFDGQTAASLSDRASAVAIPLSSTGCGGTIAGNAVVLEGEILTNRHLVERAASVRLGSATVEPLVADDGREGRSTPIDLSLLRPPLRLDGLVPADRPAVLAAEDPAPGEPVLLAGWIDGRLHTIVGRVHAYTTGGAYGDGGAMLLEPATAPGFSGGPVLDRHGDVVGILRAVDDATDLAVAVPASDIHEWRRLELGRVEPASCP